MLSVLNNTTQTAETGQPPQRNGGYLLQSLLELKAQAENQQPVALVTPAPASTLPPSNRYQQAIAAWTASMTPMQRSRAYTIDEIVKLSGLHGVNGKAACPQLVGRALHACGFTRKRIWKVAGRDRRFWSFETNQG